jgi:F-type H+-transporting ATPase subunit b
MWLNLAFKIFNFAVFVAGLYYLIRSGILARFLGMEAFHLGPYLKKRQETIKAALEEAARAKTEGEQRYREYEERFKRLDQEIEQIRQALIKEGEREKERIIKEAHRIAEKIKGQATLAAQQELKMAKLRVQEETATMTVQLAEDLLKKHLKSKDHERLVDEYIERMRRLQ